MFNNYKNNITFINDEIVLMTIKLKGKDYTFKFFSNDLDTIEKYKWCVSKYGRNKEGVRLVARVDGKSIYLKNLLCPQPNLSLKHINGDLFDYTNENLQIYRKSGNNYIKTDGYAIVFTNKQEGFLVDLKLVEEIVSIATWFISDRGYVMGRIGDKIVYLSRYIMSKCYDIEDKVIDHVNHDTLDNHKQNLRVCNVSQNGWNRGLGKNNSSDYTGVFLRKESGTWEVSIQVNGDRTYKQTNSFKEAVELRKTLEEKHYGNFSYENSVRG